MMLFAQFNYYGYLYLSYKNNRMTLKIYFKIDFFLIIVLATLMKNFDSQNVYPNIASGSKTFNAQRNVPTTLNLTFANPFGLNQLPSCIHTINGFGFQTANLATKTFFNFDTSLNLCSNTMISFQALVTDNYLSLIKFYYLAITNQQSLTSVVFQIIPIINGETEGLIRDKNFNNPRQSPFQYARQYRLSHNYSFEKLYISQNSTFMAYRCLSSLHIGTNDLLSFDIYSNYQSSINNLQTRISVYNSTYILSITIKVLLFNKFESITQNDYITYYGDNGYMNQNYNSEIVDFNVNVTHFDENYFFSFVGFRGMSLNFANIQRKSSNGQIQKHFWMEYNNPSTLKFKSNFMQDYGSFQRCYALYYYLVITKYRQKAIYDFNTQNLESSDNLMLINIITLFIIGISIVLYKKYYLPRRMMGRPISLQNSQLQIGSSISM